MEAQLIPQKNNKLTTYLAWIIVAFAIFSCSSRADYNIIVGFLILFLRSQYATDKYKMIIKAVIHTILFSLLFDLVWVWKYTGYWVHNDETSELWQSLSLIHNIAYFLGIFEALLKLPIVFVLYKKFINLGSIKELLDLNYSTPK